MWPNFSRLVAVYRIETLLAHMIRSTENGQDT
jgi:hypothetical protein